MLSGLYRHRRARVYMESVTRKSPIQTRAEVLSLVSSRLNSTDVAHSLAIRIPPNPGLPQLQRVVIVGTLHHIKKDRHCYCKISIVQSMSRIMQETTLICPCWNWEENTGKCIIGSKI